MTIVWPEAPRFGRDQLIGALQRLLHNRAQEAYLIGSYARNEAHLHSDVDVILVADTILPWPERALAFADLWQELGASDVVVYTPEEWAALRVAPTAFIRQAAHDWVRVV